jgi:hypothetical protein
MADLGWLDQELMEALGMLETDGWGQRHGHIRTTRSVDVGLRLVVAGSSSEGASVRPRIVVEVDRPGVASDDRNPALPADFGRLTVRRSRQPMILVSDRGLSTVTNR